MRMAVTGANGFIGRELCEMLARHGHAVTSIVRRDAARLRHLGAAVCLDECSEPLAWTRALQDHDAVIHLAGRAHLGEAADAATRAAFQASNVRYSQVLLEGAIAAGVGRLVFMSSSKVFGERSRRAPDGTLHRFRGDDPAAPYGPYGESKLAAEQLLRRGCALRGIRLTVFRPPLVYGPGVRGNLQALLSALLRGFPLPFGSIENLRSLIHRSQLCHAVLHAVESSEASMRVLTLTDLDTSTPALVGAMAEGLGLRARLWRCPVPALRVLGRVAGRTGAVARLTESFVVDGAEMAAALAWRPQTDHERAWREIGDALRRGTPP